MGSSGKFPFTACKETGERVLTFYHKDVRQRFTEHFFHFPCPLGQYNTVSPGTCCLRAAGWTGLSHSDLLQQYHLQLYDLQHHTSKYHNYKVPVSLRFDVLAAVNINIMVNEYVTLIIKQLCAYNSGQKNYVRSWRPHISQKLHRVTSHKK
jgi:hypothetical protein